MDSEAIFLLQVRVNLANDISMKPYFFLDQIYYQDVEKGWKSKEIVQIKDKKLTLSLWRWRIEYESLVKGGEKSTISSECKAKKNNRWGNKKARKVAMILFCFALPKYEEERLSGGEIKLKDTSTICEVVNPLIYVYHTSEDGGPTS